MILMYFGSSLALKGIGNMGQEKLIAFLVVFSRYSSLQKILQLPGSVSRKGWLQSTGLIRYWRQRKR